VIGADVDNLKKLINWATNQRTAQAANGLTINSITAQIGLDVQEVTLTWDTGIVDGNGNPLPADWRIGIPQ
jgi:hypothetical protein